MAEAAINKMQFWTRMSSLPVVTTALGQVCSLYERTKGSNVLVRYTLGTAESTVYVVVGNMMPVVTKTLPGRLPNVSLA